MAQIENFEIFGFANFGPKLARNDPERIPNGPRTNPERTENLEKKRRKTHVNYWDLTLIEKFYESSMKVLRKVIGIRSEHIQNITQTHPDQTHHKSPE